MKTDFSQFEKLRNELVKFQETEAEEFCRTCVNELAAILLAKAKKRTPVGQKPKLAGPKTVKVKINGRSRNVLSKTGEILQKYWSGYQGGELRRNWSIGSIVKKGNTYEIEIINPTFYASYVEYGHRQTPGRYVPQIGKCLKKGWVPGKFMLTISEKELRKAAPGLLEKKINQKLMEVLTRAT